MRLTLKYRASRSRLSAMTLPEVMVCTAVFTLTMGGFLAMHLFAIRFDQTVKGKLASCDQARNCMNKISSDIRSAGIVWVGNGNSTAFRQIAAGQPQIGNAIQVFPDKANTNRFIRYYCDTADDLLKRFENGSAEVVLARSVTNDFVFTTENSSGQVLTNNQNNRVIGVSLQFYQHPTSTNAPKSGFLYDYYQIQTKVTRRSLE